MKHAFVAILCSVLPLLAAKNMIVHTASGTTSFTVTAIDSITFADEVIDQGIAKHSIELFNAWGKGFCALDCVKGEGVLSKGVNSTTGYLEYNYADSARIDIKTVNSSGRASALTPNLISVNGTKFAVVSQSDFDAITKSVSLFKTKLKTAADAAKETSITYSASSPYFVAKLGNSRGYALVKVVSFSADDASSSVSNSGKISLDYYYISAVDAAK